MKCRVIELQAVLYRQDADDESF